MSAEVARLDMDIMFHRPEPEPTAGGAAEQEQPHDLRMTIDRMLFEIDTGVDEFPSELPFEPRDDGGFG